MARVMTRINVVQHCTTAAKSGRKAAMFDGRGDGGSAT